MQVGCAGLKHDQKPPDDAAELGGATNELFHAFPFLSLLGWYRGYTLRKKSKKVSVARG